MFFLIEQSEEDRLNQMKFAAALQGVDLDKQKGTRHSASSSPKNDGLLFRSPEEYDKMDPVERAELHKKMMAKFKTWAGQGGLKVKEGKA